MSQPTQSVPGSCLIGLFALFTAVLSGIGWWGLFRWVQLPDGKRQMDSAFWMILGAAGIGTLCTLGLAILALRLFKATDFRGYDPRDPDEPKAKW